MKNITTFLKPFILSVLYLIIIFISIRILELIYVSNTLNKDIPWSIFFNRSIKYDVLFILLYSSLSILPFYLIFRISKKLFKLTIGTISFAIILFNLIFTQYFLTNHSLLSSILFEFEFEELLSIASNEVSKNRFNFWITNIVIIISSLFLFFFQINKKQKNSNAFKWLKYAYIFFAIIAIFSSGNTYRKINTFKSDYHFLIANSKFIYFIKSYVKNNQNNSISNEDLFYYKYHFNSNFPQFRYVDPDYFLVHSEPYENVLGQYFDSSKTSPNIVLIISESLSMTYSGKYNQIGGSITPFTDSLANEGLYWSNFFSNAERSFGALPSILASLPFGTGERGFINIKSKFRKRYPTHTSIIQLLKKNNYKTNYFYGGWRKFDKLNYFMKANGVDLFISQRDFDTRRYQKNKKKKKMVWGHSDKNLFNQSLDIIDSINVKNPMLSVYQTLSMHSPFNLSDSSYYDRNFVIKRLKSINQTTQLLNVIPEKIIVSIIFADDALKEFFKRLKTNKAFNNTIFIITGDHGIDINLSNNVFENYQVPLIIYSPLLNSNKEFRSSSSHIDILPSLLALLEGNFNLNFPENKHWIGQGLDTSSAQKFNRFIPLNIHRSDMPNLIINNHVVYGETVYKLNNLYQIDIEKNSLEINSVNKFLEAYKVINQNVCDRNKIWEHSDTLYNNWYFE